jgi:hypothetical protein
MGHDSQGKARGPRFRGLRGCFALRSGFTIKHSLRQLSTGAAANG